MDQCWNLNSGIFVEHAVWSLIARGNIGNKDYRYWWSVSSCFTIRNYNHHFTLQIFPNNFTNSFCSFHIPSNIDFAWLPGQAGCRSAARKESIIFAVCMYQEIYWGGVVVNAVLIKPLKIIGLRFIAMQSPAAPHLCCASSNKGGPVLHCSPFMSSFTLGTHPSSRAAYSDTPAGIGWLRQGYNYLIINAQMPALKPTTWSCLQIFLKSSCPKLFAPQY